MCSSDLELIHATIIKQAPGRAAKSNKTVGNGKCMNARKTMDLYGSEARTQGSGDREKGELTLGFPLKLFWGKCPARMTSHPKEASMN